MLRSVRSHLTYVNVALALALCLALAGGALAASGGGETRKANHTIRFEDGVIRGCITKDKVVVLRERGTKCDGLQAIAWNIKGQAGAQGPKGDTGEPGPAGRNGTDGKNGVDGKDGKDGEDATGGGGGQVIVRTNSDGLPTECEQEDGFDDYKCDATDQSLRASCETGERAVGGGWKGNARDVGQGGVTENRPDPESGNPTGWVVKTSYVEGPGGSGPPPSRTPNAPFSVYVVCQAG